MARDKRPPVRFRGEQLELTQLATRITPGQASLGLVAKRDLERYYALLERSLREIKGRFTEAEISLMIDVNNGTLWQPHTMGLLGLQVLDGIGLDGLDEKWGVDAEVLQQKLLALTLPQTFAVVDACERFWCRSQRELTRETFEELGLIPASSTHG